MKLFSFLRPSGRCRPSTALAPLLLAAAVSIPSVASADIAVTSATMTSDHVSVYAVATLTFSGSTLTINLQNLKVNPSDVGQNVTGFSFDTRFGTSSVTETMSSGTVRNLQSDGTFTDSSTTGTNGSGWGLDKGSNSLALDWNTRDKRITGQNAQYTLLGQPGANGKYDASGSLKDGGAHDPFLANTLTFVLSTPGVALSNADFSNFRFSFGTSGNLANSFAAGTVTTPTAVPEPSSLVTAVVGVLPVGLIYLYRKHRRPKAASA